MAWNLNYDEAWPSLPERISFELLNQRTAPVGLGGCWHMRAEPEIAADVKSLYDQKTCYDGTLRVEVADGAIRGSGDLYLRKPPADASDRIPKFRPVRTKIPIFPTNDYRYHIQLIKFTPKGSRADTFETWFRTFRFDFKKSSWSREGNLIVDLTLSREDENLWLRGNETRNDAGTVVLKSVRAKRVSDYLRKAIVDIDRVKWVDVLPGEDAAGGRNRLEEIFEEVGWQIRVNPHGEKAPIDERAGGIWSQRDLHKHMLEWRDRNDNDLDSVWQYHLFCVRRLSNNTFHRFGLMYDAMSVDSNHVPREGAAIACMARFPLEKSILYEGTRNEKKVRTFGRASGEILARLPRAYLWTAAHELGHAMGLAHNFSGTGFMQGFPNLAELSWKKAEENGTDSDFPNDIKLEFDEEDATRLRHAPDLYVRPGGIPFLEGFRFEPVPVEDLTVTPLEVQLDVRPVVDVLPFGAPLRLTLVIRNVSQATVEVPSTLSLRSGYITGRIVTPAGTYKTFSTATRYNGVGTSDLLPGRLRAHSMTLIRGPEGALLESPGAYRVEIQVAWEVRGGGSFEISRNATILVSAPEGPSHCEAALQILSDPDVMLPVIFGTEVPASQRATRLRAAGSGVPALRRGVEEPNLRDHFAVLEAKRIAGLAGKLEEAASLIDSETVMTATEAVHIAEKLEQSFLDHTVTNAVERAARVCLERVRTQPVDPAARELVERLLREVQ